MSPTDFEYLESHYSPRREPEVLHNYREVASQYDLDVDAYHEKLSGWDEGGK
ncbi:MAG: hypothetical protein MJ200_05980 [Mycoplasmoidaceae bacterium]|nr:hypothetical protein [Mycoplasmoidaceae bacterium]